MSAAFADDTSFIELEMDNPTAHRSHAPEVDADVIELDLTEGKSRATKCLSCSAQGIPVNDASICEACHAQIDKDIAAPLPDAAGGSMMHDVVPSVDDGLEFGADDTSTLAGHLALIGQAGAANAATVGSATADGGGALGVVGFRTQDGYIQAIRNGVPEGTHREYMAVLRNRFKLSGSALAKLNLPGPMKVTELPVGEGIKHVPTGPSIFDKPKSERAFIVGPASVEHQSKLDKQKQVEATVGKFKGDLIAGACAEGHHAIVAWEGTSGMQRGDLIAALKSIGREAWSPSAPNARAQAGSAIAVLGRGGLRVRAANKSRVNTLGLAANEHVWTVVRDDHVATIGAKSGDVIARFKLTGSVLSYTGDPAMCDPVIATFQARMAAEQYKSSDVTSWLSRTIRWKLDGVRFGALGWLVPAANVAAATQLCTAIQAAGFGSGWVTGLPVATSDQLRDGIVNGLIDEVTQAMDRLQTERNEAKAAKAQAMLDARMMAAGKERNEALEAAMKLAGDIGQARAHTYLKEFRAIGERVVAYGQVLGEQRVDRARDWVRRGIVELETIVGEDFTGIRQRFGLIWEEIERDRKAAGGVL